MGAVRRQAKHHQDATNLVGDSPWCQQIRADIQRVARFSSGVLITGPSGSGKELVARAIHACSPRSESPFIPIDCASITGTLFASHMFGHVKGAFTGANHDALGGFRAADGGTIFLDEIGELEPELQAKLLRVLQERAVVPVGSFHEIPVDVRVVAATNRDLAAEVAAGRFREDLYYRLNVVSLRTAGLQDRRQDIPVLARHIFAKLAVRHGIPLKQLTPSAEERLCRYSWPGNVRQLENVLEQTALYCESEVVTAADIRGLHDAVLGRRLPDNRLPLASCPPQDASRSDEDESPTSSAAASGDGRFSDAELLGDVSDERHATSDGETTWQTIREVERAHIERTLRHTYYNQSAAARLLGIDRNLLRRKIKRYGIDVPRNRRGRPARSGSTSSRKA